MAALDGRARRSKGESMKRRTFLASGVALAALAPIRGFADAVAAAADLPARRLDGSETLLGASSIESLAGSLRGDLLAPTDAGYDSARRLWNGMFDRRPALIARCTGPADVIQAVNFAREHQLLTAVRCGGHSFSGKSSCDGGIMIDLAPMQGCRVDPAARRAFLEGGSLLGVLDRECQVFGLAVTAGVVKHTGAGGLTLGGGFGRLGRRFGLACDNVVSFDVVTASGEFIQASESSNPDLYWGLRGGGGNFGVVTSFEYRVHPIGRTVLAGEVTWPLDQARDAMRFWHEQASGAPDELNINAGVMAQPGGQGVFVVEACWSGDLAAGERALAALRAFGKPISDTIAPMGYVALQAKNDSPHGLNYYAKNGFLNALDDAGIDLILDTARAHPGAFRMALDHAGGAYSRVPPDATAFPNRSARYWLGLLSGWKDPARNDERIAGVRAAWKQVEPLTEGFYSNLDLERGLDQNRANYGANFDRLAALKAKYDPMNLFRLNANVPPRA
jgi:FAD/FMN-containing dehydrogenase